MTEPTLAELLRRAHLGLRLLSKPEELPEGTLERPLRWVHNSDLLDPTPFLTDDLVLLTTGAQFTSEAVTGPYVQRLLARGVIGLGYGTDVHSSAVPPSLIAACAAQGIALFVVPYEIPFLAVARAHSEAIAAQAYARRSWALDAQRGIALAALRPNGLDATLNELAKRLGAWVGMFDVAGTLSHGAETTPLEPDAVRELSDRTATLIARASLASQSLTIHDTPFVLFTLGSGQHMRAVIAIQTASLDPEERAVVISAIAMAGLAVEQSRQLARTNRRLRSQVLESLLLDDPSFARRVLGSLPSTPLVIAVAETSAASEALTQWWEHRAAHAPSFTAERGDGFTMVLTASDVDAVSEVATRFNIRIGVATVARYEEFSRGRAQAIAAQRRGSGSGAVHFADAVHTSVLGLGATAEARLVAEARLAPLRAEPELDTTLRVWLEHNAHYESTAQTLGIHRHTLRARITRAARLLDSDLSTFPARAEVWAALRFTDDTDG